MRETFSYSVTTVLDRERVWELLEDIENWPKVSDVYTAVMWSGVPWERGSCVLGTINYPVAIPFRYVVERCEPPSVISYMGHSVEAGFATHRTIELEETKGGTLIKVTAYAHGEPIISLPGGTMGFLQKLTERWFQDFARFCDNS